MLFSYYSRRLTAGCHFLGVSSSVTNPFAGNSVKSRGQQFRTDFENFGDFSWREMTVSASCKRLIVVLDLVCCFGGVPLNFRRASELFVRMESLWAHRHLPFRWTSELR